MPIAAGRPAKGCERLECGDMQTNAVGERERGKSPNAVAHYIATLADQLARIARDHRLDSLAYILDMAHLEAEQIAKGSADSNGRAA
jgi:hypothetical protein